MLHKVGRYLRIFQKSNHREVKQSCEQERGTSTSEHNPARPTVKYDAYPGRIDEEDEETTFSTASEDDPHEMDDDELWMKGIISDWQYFRRR